MFDVIANAMMLVHAPILINAQSSSEIINAVQRSLAILVNQIVLCSSSDAFRAAASEIESVIILTMIDDGISNQFF